MSNYWPYSHHPSSANDKVLGNRKPRYEKHIYIVRSQVYADIEAQLSIISETRKREDGTEDTTFTNAFQKYQRMFDRWIEKYVNLAKGRMAAFIMQKTQTRKADTVNTNDEIDIELSMPESYDDTSFQQLVQSVHDYIVNGALYEYLTITLTSKDPVTQDKFALTTQGYNDIKRYICSTKPGTVKKRLSPF